jgi:programmed cell death protein 5
MSEDEELKRLRQDRMKRMQQQAGPNDQGQMQQAMQNAQYQQEVERQKDALLSVILDGEARVRLNTIKMARPEFASNLEVQLIQLYSSGKLSGVVPLSDQKLKELLKQLQNQSQKRDFNIKFK